ncbi:guanylate kinase [Caulobacter sp. 17J80-11]|uniref:guanylate kinase n=1 Tax=Caulobacter sp. 17J80-11 TaxID=2763502 RepID=UPI001653488E|nr:guanylate kinase [Caulobacter sp. 17J80-11]MBC6983020.1 guanylate kinase [Caulobacter sp. 17J80-11]
MSSERTPRRGLMLIVSSPSGAGKTSLCRRLMSDHSDLVLSTSVTTRQARPGEENGREYHFITRDQFDLLIQDDDLLEWAEVHGNCYGSPRQPVERALAAGQDVLFDIDWQGARDIAAKAPDEAVRVFILPPSIAELRRRLVARAQDKPEVIERRVQNAKGEIERWREYDYVVVNDDFDRSYAELAHIYHAERSHRGRNEWLAPYIQHLLDEDV